MTTEIKKALLQLFREYVEAACFYIEKPITKARVETENPFADPFAIITVSNNMCASPERLLPGTIIKVNDGTLEFSMNLDSMYHKIQTTPDTMSKLSKVIIK